MDVDIEVWHEVFRILSTAVPDFVYPSWFAYLADNIPSDSSRARRDVPRFLSFLQAIALCLSFSDGRREKSIQIEITFGDYCIAYVILKDAFASTYAGAHPRALEFAGAVRDLFQETNSPVSTQDVADHIGWQSEVAHKWKIVAVKAKLVKYDGGTYPNNKKPLLPGPAKNATSFLPIPELVFDERPDIGDEVRFIDPVAGEERIFRRDAKKSQKKSV